MDAKNIKKAVEEYGEWCQEMGQLNLGDISDGMLQAKIARARHLINEIISELSPSSDFTRALTEENPADEASRAALLKQWRENLKGLDGIEQQLLKGGSPGEPKANSDGRNGSRASATGPK